jgi:AcrR family transcriptional regulator
MTSGPSLDRRRARHEETAALIVEEAWKLAERNGLAGLSLGELARAVQMRPQSLYTYFPSKNAIYDRMYRDGFKQLLSHLATLRGEKAPSNPDGAIEFLADAAASFVDFAAERPSRYQLLFQRTVPGFEPSHESYAVAVQALETMRTWLQGAGIAGQRDLDLWRALLLGLAGEQLANDPGGSRWRALAREAARYFVTFSRSNKGGQP